MKYLKGFLLFLTLPVGGYLLGPQPGTPVLDTTLPEVSGDLIQLEKDIAAAEAAVPNLRPDNESRIVWADSIPRKTAYSVVYLHGFTASYAEGEPIHREFARRYGCNLYLPRLYAHGLDDIDAFAGLDPDSLLASAARALAVGRQLGDRVIVMATSNGATLALILAAGHPELAGLITYSPNIAIYNKEARLLTYPWGLQLGQWLVGSRYRSYEESEEYKKYWYTQYRLEGLVAVQSLIDHGMRPETFARVRQPFFMGYYYKNEEEQDKVVSVPAMLDMFDQLGTPQAQKRKVAFPDAGRHVPTSYLTSRDLESVRRETFLFAEEVLGLKPRNDE